MGILTSLSEDLAGIVAASGPAVVRVEARRRGAASGVVWSADGIVITADHVMERDEEIRVGLPDGTAATATLVGRDAGTDLAALRVEATGLVPPTWSDEPARAGQVVVAVSRPGRATRASLGVVSAAADTWRTPAGGRLDHYVESDVRLHPGFSGSLLVDAAGKALGLNTSGLLRGAGIAVPTATLRRVVPSLVAHGGPRRGFLGVGTYAVRLPADLEQPSALLVVSVEAESPAARAGLLLGDAILSLDDTPITHPRDLLPFLEEDRIGREARLRIFRAGEIRDVTLTVGTRGGPSA
jgi:S1-C subfamily serine protease